MTYDIEYFGICVFGKLLNSRKTSGTPVKSILCDNSLFPHKECFWENKSSEIHFWERFWENKKLLGIAKYQEVLLCAGKVTKVDAKRKV